MTYNSNMVSNESALGLWFANSQIRKQMISFENFLSLEKKLLLLPTFLGTVRIY